MNISLRLENIEKNYRAVKALDGVTLNFEGGKTIALLGINGAGKTTLLRIIAGLETQDKGNVFFNNNKIDGARLRQISTLVFQRTAMFNRSVYDNLAFGLKIRGKQVTEIKEEINQALHAVGLRDFEKRKAKKISGGEQQRVSLARAFLLNPKILLLDEPTANLDPNSATIIEKAIMDKAKDDRIIILATHNLGQAKRLANELVHIYEGKIIENASPQEFFNNPRSEITRKLINGELEF